MREWLTVIIVLLIVGVLLDGARRMRLSRRSTIKMSRRVHQQSGPQNSDAGESYGSELPNGGARVVTVRAVDDAYLRNSKIKDARSSKGRAKRSPRIPEQVALNLDESVPMLMESVGDDKLKAQDKQAAAGNRRAESQHSLFGDPFVDDLAETDERGRIEPRISADFAAPPSADKPSTNKPCTNKEIDNHQDCADEIENAAIVDDFTEAAAGYDDELIPCDDSSIDDVEPYDRESEESAGDDGRYHEPPFHEPEVVLVINVMAPNGVKFSGAALLDVVLAEGLRYGSMNIFHRHAGAGGEGAALYSMANIVVPGTFDLGTMKEMVTPGVSLFMALPLDQEDQEEQEADAAPNSLQAFELMLRTAKAIAQTLHGELKDENRSVLTSQTIEHYRQRIRDFERKQLSRAPA